MHIHKSDFSKTADSFCVLLSVLCLFMAGCGNNPWPSDVVDSNCLFESMVVSIKTLDPVTAYYEHEAKIIDNIVEMPFEYHYLKRPYVLQPMLAEDMPVPVYYDSEGHVLEDEPAPEKVARAEYVIHFKKGVMYQPHPCFATDSEGRHIYLEDGALPHAASLSDFPEQGTREMEAMDFKVAIARLCDPRNASPVYTNLSSVILGMDVCSADIAEKGENPDYRQVELPGVEILDKYTLKLTLKRKYPQILYWMAMHFFAPTPWEVVAFYNRRDVAEMGFAFTHWPIGTGAYMMDEYVQDSRVVLVKNPNHRYEEYPSDGEPEDEANGLLDDKGKQIPFIDKIYFLYERESIPGWIKFTQGYYDLNDIPESIFDSATTIGNSGLGLSDDMLAKGISMHTSVRMVSYYYGINQLDPVFGGNSESSRKIRHAMEIVIDSQEYVDIFKNGRGKAAHCILPTGLPGGEISRDNYNSTVFDWDEAQNRPVKKSVEYARKLMAEAGYPNGIGTDGKRLSIAYDHASAGRPSFKSEFMWLKDKLALIGIELEDRGTDSNRFRDKVLNGNWQLLYKGWVGDYPDPENYLFLFYGENAHVPSKGRGPNYSNYISAEYDGIFKQLETMPPSEQRTELIRKAIRILQEDVPCIWDMHPTSFTLTHSWLKNFKPHEVAKNNYRYRRIDVAARTEARRNWNRVPMVPVCVVCIVVLAVAFAAGFCVKHRQ